MYLQVSQTHAVCDGQTKSLLHQAEGHRVRQKAIGEGRRQQATGERQKVAGHREKAESHRGKAEVTQQDSQSQMMEVRGHKASSTRLLAQAADCGMHDMWQSSQEQQT